MTNKKEIIKRLAKICAVCGKGVKIILYKNRAYRGGHYFGKTEKREYWECPGCYRTK